MGEKIAGERRYDETWGTADVLRRRTADLVRREFRRSTDRG